MKSSASNRLIANDWSNSNRLMLNQDWLILTPSKHQFGNTSIFISDLKILVKTCILLYKYKINSRQILRLLLEKYTKEVIEYFNNDCTVVETKILTEMIKKLFILSIKHRKEFPVHLLSHCKKGTNRPVWSYLLTAGLSRASGLRGVKFYIQSSYQLIWKPGLDDVR